MRPLRLFLWIVLVAMVALSVCGFWSAKLFDQTIWTPVGRSRLVVLVVVYLAAAAVIFQARRSWLAPVSIGAALAYTIGVAGLWAPLAVSYFLFSCLVLGRWLLRPGETGTGLDDLLAMLLGLGILIFATSIAAHFRVNHPVVYFVALLIPVVLNPRDVRICLKRVAGMLRPPPRVSASDFLAGALLIFVLIAQWLVTLKPEISADGLAMHLALPAWVAAHGYWPFDVRQVAWAVQPMGGDWAFLIAYLLGGEYAAHLLNFGLFLAILGLFYTTVRRFAPAGVALLASVMLASVPLFQLTTGSLMVENVWTAMLLGAVLSVWRYRENQRSCYLYLAAVLLGTGLATKFGALAFAASLSILGAFEIVRSLRARPLALFGTAGLSVVLVLLFAAPPYVTAWVKTGNPIFPFMNQVFRSPYFDTTPFLMTLNRFEIGAAWRLLYDLTFHTTTLSEGQNGSFGFQFLLLLPLAFCLVSRDWPYPGWASLVVSVTFLLLTFQFSPNLRYVEPALPLFMILIALALAKLATFDRRLFAAAIVCSGAVVLLNIYFLASSSWYHKDFYLNALFDRGAVDEFLESGAPQRKLIEYLNRAAPGEPVAFFDGTQIAGLHAPAFTNAWHSPDFSRRMQFSTTEADILETANDLGMQHFIYPTAKSGLPRRQMIVRFLDECTTPEMVVGWYFVSKLNPECAGANGREVVRHLRSVGEPGGYDDLDPHIHFIGNWVRDRQFAETAGGSLTYSANPGDSFEFHFTGNELIYVYSKAFNRGMASVAIDGVEKARIDMYAPATQWQSRSVFSRLGPGEHTLIVRLLPEKNPASSDRYVDCDQLIVR